MQKNVVTVVVVFAAVVVAVAADVTVATVNVIN